MLSTWEWYDWKAEMSEHLLGVYKIFRFTFNTFTAERVKVGQNSKLGFIVSSVHCWSGRCMKTVRYLHLCVAHLLRPSASL